MTKIRFEDLPSTNTPINAENLNKLNNVIVSSEEPTTGEEVWLEKGKNLIDISSLSNGYVTADGTLSSVVTYGERKSNYIKVEPNTTYTFKAFETTNKYPDWYGIGEYTLDKQFIKRLAQSTENQYITFTTSETTRYIVLSATYLADVTKVQLEKGSVATEYEPYTRKIHTKTDNGYEEFYNEEEHNKVNYSTEEQRIGTWIDGKPLYRIVYNFGTLPSTNEVKSYVTNISANTINIVRCEGFAISGKATLPLPYAGQSNNGVSLNTSLDSITGNYQIAIQCASDRSSYTGYAILEYTKTTD